MAGLVQRLKTEMRMKEAVLVGMFEELEEKRRHGLLRDGDYLTANTLTRGIETDELNLFIETPAGLRGVLTADQRVKLHAVTHPTMRLTETRAKPFARCWKPLGAKCFGWVRTSISATWRPTNWRCAWTWILKRFAPRCRRSARRKACCSTRSSRFWSRLKAQLTEGQRTKLADILPRSNRAAGAHDGADRSLGGCEERDEKTILIEQAKLKGAELTLLTILRDQNTGTLASDDKLAAAVRDLEEIRSQITGLSKRDSFSPPSSDNASILRRHWSTVANRPLADIWRTPARCRGASR